MVLDFTLDKYRELCEALKGLPVYTVTGYLSGLPSDGFVILRHDVDRRPMNALRMAELEKELGIKATYYFRYTNESFRKDVIKSVFDMGHDVGYHYETLSKAGGDYGKAVRLFREELGEFRKICDVHTVSMHGRPVSKYVSSDIWKWASFFDFDLLGDGGLSVSGVPYFTDAGRSWDNSDNVRDYLSGASQQGCGVRVTDDLIRLLRERFFSRIYLNVHPERWVSDRFQWVLSLLLDTSFNVGKKAVWVFRG